MSGMSYSSNRRSRPDVTRRNFLRASIRIGAVGGISALFVACGAAAPSTPIGTTTSASVAATTSAPGSPASTAPATPVTGNPPAPATTVALSPVKIVWSNWAIDAGSKARLEEPKRGFESTMPGATVELQNTPIGEYMTKLLANYAANTAPDIVRLNTEQLPIFASRGQVVDLDPLLARTTDAWTKRPDVKSQLVDRFRFGRGLTGLPYGGDMDALFFNKTLFAAEGATPPPLTYNDPGWTYDRVLALAKQLTKRRPDGGTNQLGIDVGGYRYEGHVENAGGSWFTVDGKTFTGHQTPAVAAIDWLAALRLTHNVSAAPGTDDARLMNFVSGKLAMSWSGVSQASNRIQDVADRFEWDVAPAPRWGNNPLVVKSGFSALTLSTQSKQPDATWSFLHWVTGPVGSLPDVELGWSVPVFTGLDSRYFSRFAGKAKNLIPALEGGNHPSKYPVWTNTNYAEAWRRIQVAIDLTFQGKGSAGDNMTAARAEVDAILAKPEKTA